MLVKSKTVPDCHSRESENASSVTSIPQHEELVYTCGGHPAKMHLKPGTMLITRTEGCGDGAVKSPNGIPSKVIR